MKILIDINHPAHVHYFRNFIKNREGKGHSFIVTNRDDELINYLLDYYRIEHIIRNKRKNNSKSRLTTLWYLFLMTFHVWKTARKAKVDAFLGFASSSCAITGFLLRKPSILLDDTEHNHLNHSLYKRFASLILTPFYFKKQIRTDQVFFDAYIEQLYLTYKEEREIDNYIFLRFIAYDASHDSNVNTDGIEQKRGEIIDILSKNHQLIISCEGDPLKEKYSQYSGTYSPEEVHEVMLKAKLVISDGATMASEAGIMGVPYIYTNPLSVGYIIEQEKHFGASYIMDYDQLLMHLHKDSSFWKDVNSRDKSINYIDPNLLLSWIFSDLTANINSIKGEIIDEEWLKKAINTIE